MAVCNLTFDEIQGLPSLEDEFEYFRVLSGEKEIEVKASSSFEAAVKMAFTLHVREGGQLDIDGRGVVYITVISPNGDEFKYRAINADPVAVELLEKNVKVSENEVNTVSTTDDPVVYTFTNASERLDFQQCGRAGRDGLPSHCKLFYNYSDKNILYRLFDEQVIAQYKGVNDLIVLLENPVQCLHQGIMSYFGEKHDSFICLTGCSNCKHRGTHQITDGTSDALKVLQAVVELSNINLTCNDLKLYLAGSNQKCVSHLQEYATFGSLGKKFVPVSLLAKFLHLLIVGDILTERIHKKGTGSSISVEITLGSKAHDLLANNFMIDKYEKT